MRTENNGGDQLARGMSRAQFRAAGSGVSQETWDKIWAEDTDDSKNDSHDANTETAGTSSAQSGEAQPDTSGR